MFAKFTKGRDEMLKSFDINKQKSQNKYGSKAQVAERLAVNQRVVGSSPTTPAK